MISLTKILNESFDKYKIEDSSKNNVVIKKCPHGHGVFAKKDFNKNDVIAIFSCGTVRKEKDLKFPKYALHIPKTKDLFWDDDEKTIHWSGYLDHSNNPNALIDFKNFNVKKPSVKLIALNDIKIDEEIFIDYYFYGDKLEK